MESLIIENENQSTPFSEWSTLKKLCLFVPVAFAVINIIIAIILLLFVDSKETSNVCETPDCMAISSIIRKLLKVDENPCENFYKFACGLLLEEDSIEAKETLSMANDVQRRLGGLIEDEQIKGPGFVKFPNLMYRKCMGPDLFRDRDILTYIKILNDLDVPMFDKNWSSENNWSWQSTIETTVHQYGYNKDSIFSIELQYVDEGTLGLLIGVAGISTESSEMLIKMFAGLLKDVIKDGEFLRSELTDAMSFRDKLKNLVKKTENRPLDPRNQEYTIKWLQEHFKYIDWLRYFNSILPEGMTFTENQEIYVQNLQYFEELGTLLAAESKRAIANYIVCSIIEESVNYFPFEEYVYANSLMNYGYNPKDVSCRNSVQRVLHHILLYNYVNKYSVQGTVALVENIKDNIMETLMETIDRNLWMNETVREEAKNKLRNIRIFIGYPPESMNKTFFEEVYAQVDFRNKNFLDMKLAIQKAEFNFFLRALLRVTDPTQLVSFSKIDFFEPIAVYIQCAFVTTSYVHVGLVDSDYYSGLLEAPNYIHYSRTGWTIAHELAHAFDYKNRKFDSESRYRNWFGAQSVAIYEERAECFKDQYSGFVDEKTKLSINGTRTLSENIADNIGLHIAFAAYTKWVRNQNEQEQLLPNLLNYTQNQLFWISAAQVYCDIIPEEVRETQIKSFPHSPPNFRIIGSFQNNQDFAKDFKCSSESTMNPPEKCFLFE